MSSRLQRPLISHLGDSALLISWGNRTSAALNAAIHKLTSILRETRPAGVIDLVPAYASILAVFDPHVVADGDLIAWINSGISVAAKSALVESAKKHHIIPVQYGGEAGPDLEELAAEEKIKPADIISAHTRKPFRVAFLGFLPGFAYMGKLPRRKPVPRLATPRTRVPAGSVGMAGFQTGIYPFASPGGWRIIGRTGLSIWNPYAASPARFEPGDSVQFVESKYEPEPVEHIAAYTPPQRPAMEVVQPGGISTIQDAGRHGLMHLGVGGSGLFDRAAAARANALVGNPPGASVLEMTLGGPEFRVTRNVTIAMDGADFQLRADSALVPQRLSWFARIGTTLRLATGSTATNRGMRAYLAVSGGFDVPAVLGSRSTSLLAGFGGFQGRVMRAGDVLGVGETHEMPQTVAGRYWLGKISDISPRDITLRFVPYNGLEAASPEALSQFSETLYLLTEKSDRMGLRLQSLDGSSLPSVGTELASFGVVPGTIQLPPAGQPVVLGPDCQTTGGYPILGGVISSDLSLLAYAVPRANIRFRAVTVDEARTIARQSQAELMSGMQLMNAQRGATR